MVRKNKVRNIKPPTHQQEVKISNKNINHYIKHAILLFKIVFSYFIVISPFFIYYFNSLELYAYQSLFKINYSFFDDSAIEMKVWNSVITFLYLLTHTNFKVIFFLIIATILTILPFIITAFMVQDEDISKSKIKLLGYVVSTISYLIFLVVVMQILEISSYFINDIKKRYIAENSLYCLTINKQNKEHLEFVISENSSVPYKLLFNESAILYFKPNEPITIWKKFSESDLMSIKSNCINLKP